MGDERQQEDRRANQADFAATIESLPVAEDLPAGPRSPRTLSGPFGRASLLPDLLGASGLDEDDHTSSPLETRASPCEDESGELLLPPVSPIESDQISTAGSEGGSIVLEEDEEEDMEAKIIARIRRQAQTRKGKLTFRLWKGQLLNSYFSRRLVVRTFFLVLINLAVILAIVLFLRLGGTADGDSCIENAVMINVVGLLNLLLGFPALGFSVTKLYAISDQDPPKIHRTLYLQLCELLVILELGYMFFLALWIFRTAVESDGTQCATFQDEVGFLVGLGTIAGFIVTLLQISDFIKFRSHLKLQLGYRDNYEKGTGRGLVSFLRSLRTKHKERKLLRKQIYEAVNAQDSKRLIGLLDRGNDTLGKQFLQEMYRTPSITFGLFAASTNNPLHRACVLGNTAILSELLQRKFPVNALDKLRKVRFNLAELFNLATHWFVPERTDSEMLSTVLVSPLHVAVVNGQSNIVDMLLDAGADVNVLAQSSFWYPAAQIPPLFLAESPVIVKQLLTRRANPLLVPKPGTMMTMTALQYAALKERSTVVPLLEEWGGDFALTPLHAAAANGNLSLIYAILSAGESPDVLGEGVAGFYKRTPLHWAAISGQASAVRLLLEFGAQVDAVDSLGRTPLHWAARHNHIQAVRMLLEAKANPTHVDYCGRNVFCSAAEVEKIGSDIFVALVSAGADINEGFVISGDTALHVAIKKSNRQTAISLLKSGANVHIRNGEGRTAIECAATAELQYAIKSEIGSRDVFITHCPTHRQFVQRLQEELEKSFITCWTSHTLSSHAVPVLANDWKENLDSVLSTTSVVLCVITDNLPSNEQCMEELALAKRMGIPIVACFCDTRSLGEELQVYLFTRQIVPFVSAISSRTMLPDGTVMIGLEDGVFEDQVRLLVDGLRDEIEMSRTQRVLRKELTASSASSLRTAISKHLSLGAATSPVNGEGEESSPFSGTSTSFVFISHGDQHLDFVELLFSSLSDLGVSCFLDSQTETSDMKERIIRAKDNILLCSAFLVVLSRESVKTELVSDQMAFAEDKGKPIIPIYLAFPDNEIVEACGVSLEDFVLFAEDVSFDSSFDGLMAQLCPTLGIDYIGPNRVGMESNQRSEHHEHHSNGGEGLHTSVFFPEPLRSPVARPSDLHQGSPLGPRPTLARRLGRGDDSFS